MKKTETELTDTSTQEYFDKMPVPEDRYFYKTDFELFVPVNDLDKAREYLRSDDMTKHLHDEFEDTLVPGEVNPIENIRWEMDDEQSGHVRLVTNRELTNQERAFTSHWIAGQNSDGIGEGFEQQEFAREIYEDDDGFEQVGEAMASFDWQWNRYELDVYEPSQQEHAQYTNVHYEPPKFENISLTDDDLSFVNDLDDGLTF